MSKDPITYLRVRLEQYSFTSHQVVDIGIPKFFALKTDDFYNNQGLIDTAKELLDHIISDPESCYTSDMKTVDRNIFRKIKKGEELYSEFMGSSNCRKDLWKGWIITQKEFDELEIILSLYHDEVGKYVD
jgi:hypothetical protein